MGKRGRTDDRSARNGTLRRLNADRQHGLSDEMQRGVGHAIVDVADRDALGLKVIEDQHFGAAVCVDRAVIIEMIPANVRQADRV